MSSMIFAFTDMFVAISIVIHGFGLENLAWLLLMKCAIIYCSYKLGAIIQIISR